ncbi:MAG: tRNA pseudouridine(55) synthase TruB [Pseudomonadota bacterium]
MGRKKRTGLPINGWLVVKKPAGPGSSTLTYHIRRLLKAQKAGHGGTLDPFAEGVLPIALGCATKTIPYLMDQTKTYRFRVRWGIETDTLDRTGKAIVTSKHRPDPAAIKAELTRWCGPIMQTPPRFSAVKIAGKRAYKLARAGVAFTPAPKPVTIHALRFEGDIDQFHSDFTMRCGSGTYVRALVRDLARALGSYGHLERLVRTQSGAFSLPDAISLAEIEKQAHKASAGKLLLPLKAALDGIPAMILEEKQATRFCHGEAIPIAACHKLSHHDDYDHSSDGTIIVMKAGRMHPRPSAPIGIASLRGQFLHARRVFA